MEDCRSLTYDCYIVTKSNRKCFSSLYHVHLPFCSLGKERKIVEENSVEGLRYRPCSVCLYFVFFPQACVINHTDIVNTVLYIS